MSQHLIFLFYPFPYLFPLFLIRVNCHFGSCGLSTFTSLVQISNFLNLGPCGFTFIVILVQNSKSSFFYCCNLPFLSFSAKVFLSN
ncbi:hypothetical protein HanIR_Chr09g0423771 [Helianthus annuus]|nr:hypothetical protein HanIR_Chr09g0423771 [Helianthus annuus]